MLNCPPGYIFVASDFAKLTPMKQIKGFIGHCVAASSKGGGNPILPAKKNFLREWMAVFGWMFRLVKTGWLDEKRRDFQAAKRISPLRAKSVTNRSSCAHSSAVRAIASIGAKIS